MNSQSKLTTQIHKATSKNKLLRALRALGAPRGAQTVWCCAPWARPGARVRFDFARNGLRLEIRTKLKKQIHRMNSQSKSNSKSKKQKQKAKAKSKRKSKGKKQKQKSKIKNKKQKQKQTQKQQA